MFNIYRNQDIQNMDNVLKIQYYKEFLQGNITVAQNIYRDNPQLQGKVIENNVFNQLLTNILNLEKYFDTGVIKELSNQLSKFQININELIIMDIFEQTKKYKINNFVLYNGLIYFCYVSPPVGTIPTNKSFWIELGLKGERGKYSLGVIYKGVWSNTKTYSEKDMVVYDNNLYVALNSNKNKNPSINISVWFKAVDMIPQIIYTSPTEPIGLTTGDIWIKKI